jgi:hypothetical protein
MGDGNERTGDENSSRRERSETADGRSNPDHRKGSASRGEDILQGRGGHNGARIHLALERVLMIAPADARFPGVRLSVRGLSTRHQSACGIRTFRPRRTGMRRSRWNASISSKTLRKPSGGSVRVRPDAGSPVRSRGRRSRACDESSRPILLCFARHRRTSRVLRLKPIRRAP